MPKAFKYISFTFFGLIILIIVSLVVLINRVDPNDFKSQISKQIDTRTGRKIQFNGKISWSFFPWLGLKFNQVNINNAPGFGDKPLADIDSLSIQVRLLPLISGHIDVGHIILKGMHLNLMINPQGKNNWQMKKRPPRSKISKLQTLRLRDEGNTNKKAPSFNISDINIIASNISWVDQQKNKQLDLLDFNLASKNISENKEFPLETDFVINQHNPPVSSKFKLTSQIKFNTNDPQVLNFNKVNASLENSHLTGNMSITNFKHPKLKFNLNIDQIDINHFTPADDISNRKIERQQKYAQDSSYKVSSGRNNFAADGKLTIGHLKVLKVNLQKLSISLHAEGNKINLSPITASLYEGTSKGSLSFDLKDRASKIVLLEKLSDVQMGALFNDLQGDEKLTGIGQIDMRISAKGNSKKQLTRTLNGQTAFAIKDGNIKGVDLSHLIAVGESFFRKDTLPVQTGPKETKFDDLSGTINVINGLASNNDLLLTSEVLKVQGNGEANLVQEHIDYNLTAQLHEKHIDAAGNPYSKPVGIQVPIRVYGSFHNIKTEPDWGELTKNILEKEGQRIIDDVEEKLPEKLKKIFSF